MIIQALLDLLYGVFALLTTPISIPTLPSEVTTIIASIMSYLNTGLAIMNCYFDVTYLWNLFMLVGSVDVGIGVYKFVMYILRKIPFFGIK